MSTFPGRHLENWLPRRFSCLSGVRNSGSGRRGERREKKEKRGEVQYVACVTRFSGFLLPGLTNDDEPINWYFGGFLTDLKVLSAALMKNGLKRRPGVARSSERENSRVHLVKLDLATAAWRRQCAQCAPSCSPQSPYAHAIGPSYQNCGGEKACNREKAQP